MDFNFREVLKKIELPWQREGGIVGIDFGTSSIKAVQLKKEKERGVLETYGELSIGPYADLKVGQAVKLSEEKSVEALKDLMREANIKTKKAAVSIPLSTSFLTAIVLPFSPDRDISDIVTMEARRYIPVPISEVLLDWWIIPDSPNSQINPNKKITSILLAATHKETINGYRKVVEGAGLDVKFYEIECFGLIRSCLSGENSPVAILDMGATSTKLIIIDYGALKESHTISHGSQEITLALSRSLGIDFGRAEEMKREIGLSPLPENQQIVSVREPILNYIYSEVNRFLASFQAKNGRPVGKIIMSGGGSMLKGIVDLFIKKFTIEVELADPFSKVEHPVLISGALKEIGVNFSAALGLAIRDL